MLPSPRNRKTPTLQRNASPNDTSRKILWEHLRVIEVDGKIHEQQIEYDIERDKILSARGLRLLRFKNEEITEKMDQVLMRIYQTCSEKIG